MSPTPVKRRHEGRTYRSVSGHKYQMSARAPGTEAVPHWGEGEWSGESGSNDGLYHPGTSNQADNGQYHANQDRSADQSASEQQSQSQQGQSQQGQSQQGQSQQGQSQQGQSAGSQQGQSSSGQSGAWGQGQQGTQDGSTSGQSTGSQAGSASGQGSGSQTGSSSGQGSSSQGQSQQGQSSSGQSISGQAGSYGQGQQGSQAGSSGQSQQGASSQGQSQQGQQAGTSGQSQQAQTGQQQSQNAANSESNQASSQQQQAASNSNANSQSNQQSQGNQNSQANQNAAANMAALTAAQQQAAANDAYNDQISHHNKPQNNHKNNNNQNSHHNPHNMLNHQNDNDNDDDLVDDTDDLDDADDLDDRPHSVPPNHDDFDPTRTNTLNSSPSSTGGAAGAGSGPGSWHTATAVLSVFLAIAVVGGLIAAWIWRRKRAEKKAVPHGEKIQDAFQNGVSSTRKRASNMYASFIGTATGTSAGALGAVRNSLKDPLPYMNRGPRNNSRIGFAEPIREVNSSSGSSSQSRHYDTEHSDMSAEKRHVNYSTPTLVVSPTEEREREQSIPTVRHVPSGRPELQRSNSIDGRIGLATSPESDADQAERAAENNPLTSNSTGHLPTPRTGQNLLAITSMVPSNTSIYRAEIGFTAKKVGQMDLREGQAVTIRQSFDDGWVLCAVADSGREGLAPRACLSAWPIKSNIGNSPSEGTRSPEPMSSPGTPRFYSHFFSKRSAS